ncbi:phosphoenolpyruvate carboxykinase (ATP) [bacterium]|nr:phosphoenolpyruvate carboxykinase (ATP) [candidate division CSSED10-310 bacterium]
MLTEHLGRHTDIPRETMIRVILDRREAIPASCGALATWTPVESTGRSPKDTVLVRRKESEGDIDWDSPNNLPIEPATFDMLLEDAVTVLSESTEVFETNRVVGADPSMAMPVRTISTDCLPALFTDNMFRPIPPDIETSCFYGKPFTLLVLPYTKLERDRYDGRLRKLPDGRTSDMAIAMDLDRRMGIVFGSAYCGSVKKLIFSVMNYYLPGEGILPLHCSANEGSNGDIALLLGLSGTGKTTLSAVPDRALLGDDEHAWSDHGIANFEYGCYAKLINLDPEKEPEIFDACFHDDDVMYHGAIIENAMMYPDGSFDLNDERYTPNSRGSYPLRYLSNIKPSSRGNHPQTILFLTADANGVLPPIARLNTHQAMLWFLMGYTSKLAGTETGIVEPKTTFSRFFGEPFMPRNPDVYASMLGNRMRKHQTRVFLINTGWSGGPYGIGKRMDIRLTRKLVDAAMSGRLDSVDYIDDHRFHLQIPMTVPGLEDATLLQPINTWTDKDAFEKRADRLASEFANHFKRAYGGKGIDPTVEAQCPGK